MDVDRLAEVAIELIARLRTEGTIDNAQWLGARLPDSKDWFRLSFVLAAAVPDDRSWVSLTHWARAQMSVCSETVSRDVSRANHGASVAPPDNDRLDEIAIERACHGEKVPLSPKERKAAVEKLTRRGMSKFEIADRLGISDRTVVRWRAQTAAS